MARSATERVLGMSEIIKFKIYIDPPNSIPIRIDPVWDKIYRIDRVIYLEKTSTGETIFLTEYESEQDAIDSSYVLHHDLADVIRDGEEGDNTELIVADPDDEVSLQSVRNRAYRLKFREEYKNRVIF